MTNIFGLHVECCKTPRYTIILRWGGGGKEKEPKTWPLVACFVLNIVSIFLVSDSHV